MGVNSVKIEDKRRVRMDLKYFKVENPQLIKKKITCMTREIFSLNRRKLQPLSKYKERTITHSLL